MAGALLLDLSDSKVVISKSDPIRIPSSFLKLKIYQRLSGRLCYYRTAIIYRPTCSRWLLFQPSMSSSQYGFKSN